MTANFFKIAPIALLLSFLTACGGESADSTAPKADSDTTAQADNNLPIYKVGIDTPYPPFVQMGEKGGYEGFDVDLLTEIGKREGFALSYEPRKWDGIFDLLDNRELDIVASGVFETPERKAKYGLSVPYHAETMVLIVGKHSNVATFNDAKGKKVAYVPGSVGASILQNLEGGKELDPSLAKEASWPAIKSVIQKETELAIDTSSAYEHYSKQHAEQGLKVVYQDNPEWLDIVFAVKQDNKQLLDKLNKGIASVKADGTYDKIKAKWFTKTSQATPQHAHQDGEHKNEQGATHQ